MDYLLKASGLVLIFFLFYYTFLKNETFFKSIRIYFLIGLILVVSIPLIKIPIYVEQVVSNLNSVNYSNFSLEDFKTNQNSINWMQLASIFYIIGVGFFTLKFLIQLISLGKLFSKYKFKKQGTYYFVETSKNISPFSFFKIIIYNKTHFKVDELEQVINHEKAHALQWHTVDTLLAHLLVILLWFNPFVWLYKKAVQQNLEFLADEYAIELAQNQELYQFTLLKTCSKTYCNTATNNFYNSLIKKRILMLQKNRSTKNSQWKYTLLLPILVAFIISFSTKIVAQEKKLTEVEESNKQKVELIIDKTSTDENLKNKTVFFKKEFDININFKGIKRNSNNEITSIKIDANGSDLKAKFENSGNNPINPIKISYDSEDNTILIGNLKELNEKHFDYRVSNTDNVAISPNLKENEHIMFFSNDGNDTIKTEKIIVNGTEKKVWIQEKNDAKNIEIEILNEKDNKQENIFILKSDSDNKKIHKESNKATFVIKGDGEEKPLIIINGKEITSKEMEAINHENIESINVLKDESADKKYGDKGKNGVIEIKLKNTDYSKSLEPLFIVDEKEILSTEAKEINPDNIKSMNVLKGEKAIEKYGKKAENGVVEITTKQD